MKIIAPLLLSIRVVFIVSFRNNEWNANIFVQTHFRGTDCNLSDLMKFPAAVLSQVFASVYALRVLYSVGPIVRRFYFCSFLLSRLLRGRIRFRPEESEEETILLRSLSIDILTENGRARTLERIEAFT